MLLPLGASGVLPPLVPPAAAAVLLLWLAVSVGAGMGGGFQLREEGRPMPLPSGG
jgi:hypothetical protein